MVKKNNPNNITKCPFCNFICSINLSYEKRISIIEYECEGRLIFIMIENNFSNSKFKL